MGELTPEQLEQLRRVAEAATPGEWFQDPREPLAVRARFEEPDESGTIGYEVLRASGFGPKHEADAHFSATFDPTTVLALLNEIERLRAENAHLISDIKFITAPVEVGGGADAYLRAEVERLRREREVLAAAVRLREEARKANAAILRSRPGEARTAVEAAWAAKDAAEDAHEAALALLDGEKGGGGA